MPLDHIPNIVIPCSVDASTCGYCSPPGQRSKHATSYHSANLVAISLTPSVYQAMIDRGWRRSGTYCYKPDLKASCCPAYTIKLAVEEFKPSRSQRQLLNRWNRFVLQDGNSKDDNASKPNDGKATKKKTVSEFVSLSDTIHASEHGVQADVQASHRFEVTLEPSNYTAEKFALYKSYQQNIHNDHRESPDAFNRFLIESPLRLEPIPYSTPPPEHLPRFYGSYHQLYRLDGKLIALGVIDILPTCVSSVYFIYDKDYERFSLGKLSALREISLAQEIRAAGVLSMESLYMGFYIHSCPKMRYKGEYQPSYLTDPETYDWYPFKDCLPLLEAHHYACFSDPAHSLDEVVSQEEFVFEQEAPEFDGVKVLARNSSGDIVETLIRETRYLSKSRVREELGLCIRGLGGSIAKEVTFNV